jgi:NADH-quinone oxidoreductase subunit A
MQYAFLPVLLLVLCAIGLAIGLLIVSGLFNPGRPGSVTRMPYESGMDPIHDTHRRFDVRFHLLAIAFLIFDVELLFLYPWAVAVGSERNSGEWRVESGEWKAEAVASGQWPAASNSSSVPHSSSLSTLHSPLSTSSGIDTAGRIESRHFIFGGAMTFLLLLTLGFVYDWRKGIFRWR